MYATQSTVGQLATEHPHAVKIFHRHGIDFCCGGGRTIAEACSGKGIAVDTVLAEIAEEEARQTKPATRWDAEPLDALINHILEAYHVPLYTELPRLEQMARKVYDVHGPKDRERLNAIKNLVIALKDDLDPHMVKEERVLFPWIKSGQGASAGAPVRMMLAEHDAVGEMLVQLRELTHDYAIPEGACATWTALWQGLQWLERELHEHIHLENNVLFPRALAG